MKTIFKNIWSTALVAVVAATFSAEVSAMGSRPAVEAKASAPKKEKKKTGTPSYSGSQPSSAATAKTPSTTAVAPAAGAPSSDSVVRFPASTTFTYQLSGTLKSHSAKTIFIDLFDTSASKISACKLFRAVVTPSQRA